MTSAIAAFLSVVLAIVLGIAALEVLGSASHGGRDFMPMVGFAGVFLIVSGFIYGRLFLTTIRACVAGLAAYALVVGLLVADLGGTAVGTFFLDWFGLTIAVTLLPWCLGLLAGKYAQRFQLTP